MSTLQNKVNLIGRLGKDPMFQTVGTAGHKKVSFPLATNEPYKTKDGEWTTNTQWHNVIAWGPMAEAMSKLLSKGYRIALEGRLATNTYEKDGEKKTFVNIEAHNFMNLNEDPKNEGSEESSPATNTKKK